MSVTVVTTVFVVDDVTHVSDIASIGNAMMRTAYAGSMAHFKLKK